MNKLDKLQLARLAHDSATESAARLLEEAGRNDLANDVRGKSFDDWKRFICSQFDDRLES